MSSNRKDEKYYVNVRNYKYVFLSRSCLLKNTERTQKYFLHQFSTKLTRDELVKRHALFAGVDLVSNYID